VKRIGLIILLFWAICIFNTYGQQVLFGAKGAFAKTHILNNYITELSTVADYKPSFGGSIGLLGGYKFLNDFRITTEILFDIHTQRYNGLMGLYNEPFESTTKLQSLEIPLIFRYGDLWFIEFGGGFSYLHKATNDYTLHDNVRHDFNVYNITTCLGGGFDIYAAPKIILTVGMRAKFGPVNIKGVDSRGLSIHDDLGPLYGNYYKTHTLSVGIYISARTKFKIRSNKYLQTKGKGKNNC